MKNISRRSFLGAAFATGTGAAMMGIAGCAPKTPTPNSEDTLADTGSKTIDWLGTAPEIDESQIGQTVETDVLVVGAAVGGSFAAYGALKNGSEVIIIDKHHTFHYGGAGASFINSKLQKESGMPEYDPTEVLYELINNMQCRCNPSLLALWTYRSGDLCDSIVEDIAKPYGIPYEAKAMNEFEKRQVSAFKSTEVKFGDPFADNYKEFLTGVHQYIEDQGGQFVYNTRAVKLTQDENGTVDGIIATDPNGSYVLYKARKGVVMCTGSYGANTDMVDTFMAPKIKPLMEAGLMYNGYLEQEDVPSEDLDTGDGHKMMCWLGADMEDATHSYNGWTMAGITSAPFLNVAQKSGRRFQHEGMSFLNQLQMVAEQPHEDGYYYWQILSDNPMDMPTLLSLPEEVRLAQLDASPILEADSLEDLADQMGVDKTQFIETVERYNELCEKGFDEDFGKHSEFLLPVTKAPFKAIKVNVGVAVTLSGVNCDNKLRVLNTDGLPIEGLYAAGNTVGGRFGWAYEGTHIGLTNALAMIHGFVAGESASQR